MTVINELSSIFLFLQNTNRGTNPKCWVVISLINMMPNRSSILLTFGQGANLKTIPYCSNDWGPEFCCWRPPFRQFIFWVIKRGCIADLSNFEGRCWHWAETTENSFLHNVICISIFHTFTVVLSCSHFPNSFYFLSRLYLENRLKRLHEFLTMLQRKRCIC